MLSSTQQFLNILDAHGNRYTVSEPTPGGKDVVTVTFGGESMPAIRIRLFFDKDCQGVALRVFDIVKVPEERQAAVLSTLNGLNCRFRFVKFCLLAQDQTVQAETDAVFRENDVGEICRELALRCASICDDAYPELMKAIWT